MCKYVSDVFSVDVLVISYHFLFFKGCTAGFLIHGRRARIFGQIFDQILGHIFDQGFWPGFFGTENTVLKYYRDRKIHFCSTTGTEKT